MEGNATRTTMILEYDAEPVKGPDLPKALYSHCLVRLNSSHLLLHGGKSEKSEDRGLDSTFMFDITTFKFEEVESSESGFHGHACGIMRNEDLGEAMVAAGGGSEFRFIEAYNISSNEWSRLEDFPEGLSVHDRAARQTEDSVQVRTFSSSEILAHNSDFSYVKCNNYI